MTGTEKQIETARTIVAETVASITSYLVTGGPVPPAEFGLWQLTRANALAFIAWLHTLQDSPQIIDWFGSRTRPYRTLKVIMAFERAVTNGEKDG